MPKAKVKVSHAALVKTVIEALNGVGLAYVWKMQSGLFKDWRSKPVGHIGRPGVPDICGITAKGRFLGVEVKVGADRQRAAQKAFQERCDEAGALYILYRDTDELDTLIRLVRSS